MANICVGQVALHQLSTERPPLVSTTLINTIRADHLNLLKNGIPVTELSNGKKTHDTLSLAVTELDGEILLSSQKKKKGFFSSTKSVDKVNRSINISSIIAVYRGGWQGCIIDVPKPKSQNKTSKNVSLPPPMDDSRDPPPRLHDQDFYSDEDYIFRVHYQNNEEKLTLSIVSVDATTKFCNHVLLFENQKMLQAFYDALCSCIKWNVTEPKLLLQNLDHSLVRHIFRKRGKRSDGKEINNIKASNNMSRKEFVSVIPMEVGLYHTKSKVVIKHWNNYCTTKNLSKDCRLTANECAELLKLLRDDASNNIKLPYTSVLKIVQKSPTAENNGSMNADLNSTNHITAVQFQNFLRHEQNEKNVSLTEVRELFHKISTADYAKKSSGGGEKGSSTTITKDSFLNFLQSDENDAFSPAKGRLNIDDMNMPLCNYWINTIDGAWEDGLGGVIIALMRGCRCLELALWEDKTGTPVVCRSKPDNMQENLFLFVDIIKQVKTFLLDNRNVYPIILLLQNHCSKYAQSKIARVLQDVLGNSLFVPQTLSGILPSPESLKGKVVIKFKHPAQENSGFAIFDDEAIRADKKGLNLDIENAPTFESLPWADSLISDSPHLNEDHTPGQLLEIATVEAKQAKEKAQKADDIAFRAAVKAKDAEDVAERLHLIYKEEAEKLGKYKEEAEKLEMTMTENSKENQHEPILTLLSQMSIPSSFVSRKMAGSPAHKAGIEAILRDDSTLGESRLNKLQRTFHDAQEADTTANEILAEALTELQNASAKVMATKNKIDALNAEEKKKRAYEALEKAKGSREDNINAINTVLKLRADLLRVQSEAQNAEDSAKIATHEMQTNQRRARDADARANEANAKFSEAQMAAAAEVRVLEVLEKEAAIARSACKSSEQQASATKKLKNEAKRQLIQEQKANLAEALKLANDAHVVALVYAKVDREALSSAEKKASKQTEKAALVRNQADHFLRISQALQNHADEANQIARQKRIEQEKAEAAFRRAEIELQSSKSQLAEAISRAQSSGKSVEDIVSSAKRLKDEAREAQKKNVSLQSELRLDIGQENLARKAFNSRQEVRDKKRNELAAAQNIHAKAMEKSDAANREETEMIYKELKISQALRNFGDAKGRAEIIRDRASGLKEAADDANTTAAQKATEMHHARLYEEKKKKQKPVSSVLCSLTLLHESKFKAWEKSLTEPYCNMHSLPQTEVEHILNREQVSWDMFLKYNKNHMTRVFESEDKEVNSVRQWALGSQLVSVRWHDFNEIARNENWINDGRFRENGQSGYVLKPSLRSQSGLQKESCRLKIRVLCGNRIPGRTYQTKSYASNLTVQVSVYDAASSSRDTHTSVHSTAPVIGDRLYPTWNESETTCAKFGVFNMDVAMILFSVWDSQESTGQVQLVGVSAIPFSCLRQGYRSVQLFDENFTRYGAYSFASLFVHISIR